MATISKTILPIPESVVVGSGSYTVPANKYGFLSGSAATSATGVPGGSTLSAGSAAAVSNIYQWLTAGTSITTSGSSASASGVTSETYSTSTATISLNGTTATQSHARAFTVGQGSPYTAEIYGGYTVAWSVSLFPIPVNNLPDSLIT